MAIAVPTGVKIFNWLFTMWKGKIRFTVPMLYSVGFIPLFTIGGVTGVMLAMSAADYQYHNTMFLVAHFHNTIIPGVVFAMLAGLTYYWPKFFGFMLNEKIGKWYILVTFSRFRTCLLPNVYHWFRRSSTSYVHLLRSNWLWTIKHDVILSVLL